MKNNGPHVPAIGNQPRRLAESLIGDVRKGVDPAEAKRAKAVDDKSALTLAVVAADFMELHVKAKRKPRTGIEYGKLLDAVILPALGSRRVRDLVAGDIERWHHGHRATPYHANRALAVLSKLLSWSTSRGYRTGDNPCRAVVRCWMSWRRSVTANSPISA